MQTKGIVDGVVYLHSRNPPVIHGDLHDRNILITVSGDPLICDFGLSHINHSIPRTNTTHSEGGYPRFVAPELSSGAEPYSNEASDIYSLGMTIYSLGVGKKPFWKIKIAAQAQRLLESGRRPEPEAVSQSVNDSETFRGLDAHSTSKLWLLLPQMWAHKPAERITAIAVRKELVLSGLIILSPLRAEPLKTNPRPGSYCFSPP
ncbi:kinase-like protein [Clavulina sp. PMI_390]|nr:kinase-like protein [Clavulina sp. PMI_390]